MKARWSELLSTWRETWQQRLLLFVFMILWQPMVVVRVNSAVVVNTTRRNEQAEKEEKKEPWAPTQAKRSPDAAAVPQQQRECSIYLAPSSLLPTGGLGIFTTRDIRLGESFLQAPDLPSIPVWDYGEYDLPMVAMTTTSVEDNDDDDDEEQDYVHADPDEARARRQFKTLFDSYWWTHGKPDHVRYLVDDTHDQETTDFQITFGSLPNHHCLLHSLDAHYPHPSQNNGFAAYDDSSRLQPSMLGQGAFSYNAGRDFRANRMVRAGEEIFLNYGHCGDHSVLEELLLVDEEDDDDDDEEDDDDDDENEEDDETEPRIRPYLLLDDDGQEQEGEKEEHSVRSRIRDNQLRVHWKLRVPNRNDYLEVAKLLKEYIWPTVLRFLAKPDHQHPNQTLNWDRFRAQYAKYHPVHSFIVDHLLPTSLDQVRLLMNATHRPEYFGAAGRFLSFDSSPGSEDTNGEEEDHDELEDEAVAMRVAYYQGTTPRTVDWIRQHGLCLEHLIPKLSPIPHAGYGAFAQHNIPQGEVVVPAPILQIVNRSALHLYDGVGNRVGTQLLLNYCIGHVESTVLLCPNTNAILINHNSHAPNAQFQWSDYDAQSEAWRRLSIEELWDWSRSGQRGLFMHVIALRDISMGEEVTVDYGPDWEGAWNQYVQQEQRRQQEQPQQRSLASVKQANEEEVIQLLSNDLRKTTIHTHSYMFTGCQYLPTERDYSYKAPDHIDGDSSSTSSLMEERDWEALDDESLLRIYSTDYRADPMRSPTPPATDTATAGEHHGRPPTWDDYYSTHWDQSYWPCSVIFATTTTKETTTPGSSTTNHTERDTAQTNPPFHSYTVRIHQNPQQDDTIWTKWNVPRFVTHVPRGAIHYFVQPYASDAQRPTAFRHFLGLAEVNEATAFPQQWKNVNPSNPRNVTGIDVVNNSTCGATAAATTSTNAHTNHSMNVLPNEDESV